MLRDRDGVAGKEKINMDLGRKKALETKVHFVIPPKAHYTMLSLRSPILHGVQSMPMHLDPAFLFTHPSTHMLCLVPGTGKLVDCKLRSWVMPFKLSKTDIAPHGVYRIEEEQMFKSKTKQLN